MSAWSTGSRAASTKGATSCGPQSPTDPEGPPCCSGLTCRTTFAPVGGNGKVCQ
ncbi:hypothetical protein CH063_15721 [Colletotrichum higginsianum]|uniref:Uncharacterized protein n=1 Tax=Colletotrichum higginsianum (strain IMI 349063) TaxID=759273 RepID=H1W450_COLHI|nr:hypothetical protein CH063_15721 [Colletotrichum higginsianum]